MSDVAEPPVRDVDGNALHMGDIIELVECDHGQLWWGGAA